MDRVEIPDDQIDPNSHGIIAMRVDGVVHELGLEYGGLEEGGHLVLYPVRSDVQLPEGELRVELRNRLEQNGLRDDLGVTSFEITSPP